MGDRANIVSKYFNEQIVLYTHWNGYCILDSVQTSLKRAKEEGRLKDYQYLNRILFCDLIGKDQWDESTGFGISQTIHDGDHNVVTLDVKEQTVSVDNYYVSAEIFTFEEFMKIDISRLTKDEDEEDDEIYDEDDE